MDDKIEQRLAELRGEYEEGKKQLRAIEQRMAELQNTLLRISGAIQVLEEIQANESSEG